MSTRMTLSARAVCMSRQGILRLSNRTVPNISIFSRHAVRSNVARQMSTSPAIDSVKPSIAIPIGLASGSLSALTGTCNSIVRLPPVAHGMLTPSAPHRRWGRRADHPGPAQLVTSVAASMQRNVPFGRHIQVRGRRRVAWYESLWPHGWAPRHAIHIAGRPGARRTSWPGCPTFPSPSPSYVRHGHRSTVCAMIRNQLGRRHAAGRRVIGYCAVRRAGCQ
jgi:hypothetical protein